MADSVYRVTEVIGVSSESWEAAARADAENGITCTVLAFNSGGCLPGGGPSMRPPPSAALLRAAS